MEAPPNFGRDYIVSFHQVYPALAAKYRRRARAVPAAGRRGHRDAEPARRHPSDGRRRAHRRRQRLGGARSRSPRRPGDGPPIMIELRDVSKTVMSGTEPLTILHPLSLADSARPVRGDRRAVGQRQVDAARPDRRPRRAVVRVGAHRRRRHHAARRGRAGEAARREDRLRLPVLSPDSVADRATRTSPCRWRSPASPTPRPRAERCSRKSG